MIEFRKIDYGSTEYFEALQLRREVLRWPLGLEFSAAEIEAESSEEHFAIYHGKIIVVCGSFRSISAEEAKMRQVAVSPLRQGQGLGSALVAGMEAACSALMISLHSRKTAVSFYEANGYLRLGNEFEEVGLPHVKMRKIL